MRYIQCPNCGAPRFKTESETDPMASNIQASNIQAATAKIYQFPVGGRAGLAGTSAPLSKLEEMERAAATRIAVGGSWYHDVAVHEADKDHQH